MSEWKELSLNSFMDFNPSTPLKKGMECIKVSMEHLTPNGKKIRDWEISNYNGGAKFINGDTLVARITPCLENGKIGYVDILKDDEVAFGSTEFIVLREKQNISDSQFIFYFAFWNEFRDLAIQLMTGSSGRQRVETDALKNKMFVFPPLPEQKAIAGVLSSLDDKIDLLHRQNKTLEAMAEALFRQWLVEEAQEDWEEKTLGEILTITSSKRIFYSEYVPFGIPFYRSKEIIELRNTGSTTSELYISNERFNEIVSKYGIPNEGDILMTSVGTLGVAYRVKNTDNFYFKDGNLTWFKDFNDLPSSIIYLWLISSIGQSELGSITIGSTQQALTIEGLKRIRINIPPKNIIDNCDNFFKDIISKIDHNQVQIQTLEKLRDTLLPKLMSGEVRVAA